MVDGELPGDGPTRFLDHLGCVLGFGRVPATQDQHGAEILAAD
jgi:hypothetical protein